MIGISMVRDEGDIVGYTLQHLFCEGVDRVVIADNRSTDDTAAVLDGWARRHPNWLQILPDPEPGYYQSEKITRIAALYAQPGEWVVPFDADELWTGLDKLRGLEADRVRCTVLTHIASQADRPDEPNPYLRITRRAAQPERLPKFAFRWRRGIRIGDGNHAVDGAGDVQVGDVLDVRHFQYRTLEQTRRKVRQGAEALRASTKPDHCGAHWRQLAALDDDRLAEWWERHIGQPTVEDPAPW